MSSQTSAQTPLKAILFGSIGTLVETSEIQRDAFNRAFKDSGLDWHWDEAFYRNALVNSGGQNRIAAYAQEKGQQVDAAQLHALKTRYFDQVLETGELQPRPGVLETMKYAYKNGLDVGFVTSTSRDNVDAILLSLGNTITENDFQFISDASMVQTYKPSPAIYFEALDRLGYGANEVIAIEDSQPSLEAAVAAGIATIAFPGFNTASQNYSKAVKVVDELTPDLFENFSRTHVAHAS